MNAPLSNDTASRPYKVVTEFGEHACPSCHQDAPGHIVVGPDDIGFGTTYFGEEGKDEAEDLADMLNDAYEAGRESVTAKADLLRRRREHTDCVALIDAALVELDGG